MAETSPTCSIIVASAIGTIVIMALTRMVSLGSISAAILFPILAIPFQAGFIVEGNYFVFAIIMAFIVIFNHRSNLKRIFNGTENRLSFKKKEEKTETTEDKETKEVKTEKEEKVENKVEEVKENKE